MGKQESVSDLFQMAKDYAKAENELKIEKWVQITIEYNDEVKHEPVRLCAEKRLDFRKHTRTIKEQVAEYERMTVGLVGRDIQEFLEGSVDSFFDEAHDHITKLQMAVQQEKKKVC